VATSNNASLHGPTRSSFSPKPSLITRSVWLPLWWICTAWSQTTGGLVAAEPEPQVLMVGSATYELAPHGQGNVYAPSVLIEQGTWKMWYGAQGKDGHDRICYAESRDRQHWQKYGVVLEDPQANHINDPCVLRVGDAYIMFYTRAEKDIIDQIYVATSKDGLIWGDRKVALPAGPPSAWDSLSVGRPSVLYEHGGFRMWYDGRQDFPPGTPVQGVPFSANSHRYVGYATSPDGYNWTRQGNQPVFGNDAGGIDVKRIGNKLWLLYESQGGTRYASSLDGVNWVDAGWLVHTSGNAVDRFGHVTPNLWIDSTERLHLFLGAAPDASWNKNCIAVWELPENAVDKR